MSRTLILSLLISLSMLVSACQPGDEAPPEEGLQILGQSIPELLGISTINGNYWEGTSGFEDCVYTPVAGTTLYNCSLLETAQNFVDANIARNTILLLDLQGNVVNAQMILAVPHFNGVANTFDIRLRGGSSTGSDPNYPVLILTQTSSSQLAAGAGLSASVSEFRAEQRLDLLIGEMKVRLTDASKTDTATITYGFSLEKKL